MGQIKNIKLHIVTDIKSLRTFSSKMAYTSDAQFEQVDPYAETEAPPAAKKQRTDNRTDNRFCEQDDVIVLKEKVFIPVEQHPGYNFVGSILGPSGSILKELTKATKSKIAILGKGSMKDKAKEEELMTSDEKEHAHLKEPLHVLIDIKAPRADAHLRMHIALMEIYKFMTPPDKQEQQFDQGPFGFGGGFGGPFRGRGGPRGGPRGRGGRGRGYGGY